MLVIASDRQPSADRQLVVSINQQWISFLFFFGPDQDELAWPALFTVLEKTSRNQGSELSSATMIPQWLWLRIWISVDIMSAVETISGDH